MDKENDPYREGYSAGINEDLSYSPYAEYSDSIKDLDLLRVLGELAGNPYVIGTKEFEEWNKGYLDSSFRL